MASNQQTRLTAKLNEFNGTMATLRAVTKRTASEELNKQLLQLVIGAKGSKGLVQLTKKATVERITADMSKLVNNGSRGGKTRTLGQMLGILLLKKRGEAITAASIDSAAAAILKARIQSRAFIAASWLLSGRELAKHVPSARLDRMGDGDIPVRHGGYVEKTARAIPATLNQNVFTASVFNTSPSHPNNTQGGKSAGAEKVARAGMNRALGNAIRDMKKKIQYELGKQYAIATAKRMGVRV